MESSSSSGPPAPVPTEDTALEFIIIGSVIIAILLAVCCTLAFCCRKFIRFTQKDAKLERAAEEERDNIEKQLGAMLPEVTTGAKAGAAGGDSDEDRSNNSAEKPLVLEGHDEEPEHSPIGSDFGGSEDDLKLDDVKRGVRPGDKKGRNNKRKGGGPPSDVSSLLSTSSDEEGNPKPSTIRKRQQKEFERRLMMEEMAARSAALDAKHGGGLFGQDSDDEVPLEEAMIPVKEHPHNFLYPPPTEYSKGAMADVPPAYLSLTRRAAAQTAERDRYQKGNLDQKLAVTKPDVFKSGLPARTKAPDPKNPLLRPPRRPIAKEETPWHYEASTLMQNRIKALVKEEKKKPKAKAHVSIDDATFVESDSSGGEDDDRQLRSGSESGRSSGSRGSSTWSESNSLSHTQSLLMSMTAYRGAKGTAYTKGGGGHGGTNSSTSGSYATGTSFMSGGSALGARYPPPNENTWKPVTSTYKRLSDARQRAQGLDPDSSPKILRNKHNLIPREDTHIFDINLPKKFEDL